MKKHYRMLINHADAKDPEDNYWVEESWSEKTPPEIIKFFNNTLYPRQKPRILITWFELEEEGKTNKPHNWSKSSLVTQMATGGVSYDAYKCSDCGAKGKRFGLSSSVTPDRKNQRYCTIS